MNTRVVRRVLLLASCCTWLIACEGPAGPGGAPGISCTVTDNGDGTSTIACSDGTSTTVSNGTSGASCTITDNGDGTKTITCDDGTSVTVSDGPPGNPGNPGNPGGNVEVSSLHGTDYLQSIGEFLTAGKYFATATITGAAADAAGVVTVEFTVADPTGAPVSNVPTVSANVAKLVPETLTERSKWVPYIYRIETVTGSDLPGNDWPNPDGTIGIQGSRETSGTGATNGTLTNLGGGKYKYVFKTNLSNVSVNGTPIAYERNLVHRVSVMMGGHSGATADAVFDFVPDGSPAGASRDIVQTAACKSCHGEEFHGHGGDRLGTQNCATCHVPGTTDAQSGESLDLKVMIHKIHAGGELASIPGPDGIVWDNPATPANEAADNGSYAIWGYGNHKIDWWKVGFPAVIANCTKCHTGTGADVDDWKNEPSRAACGSCHDDVDFATGTNHPGGPLTNDQECGTCHRPEGIPGSPLEPFGVVNAHDWLKKDARNIPEFDVTLTVSTPANNKFFVAGEAPMVSIVLKDKVTGVAIDHTTVVKDTAPEGCTGNPCPPGDGLFAASSFFVHGPRARRMPVLTTSARSVVFSTTAASYDLSAAGATLVLKLDQGYDIIKSDALGTILAGNVTVPVASGTFANKAAATPDEIVAWLNGNAAFKARAIAFLQGGKIGIRSRNLGQVFAVQLAASEVATKVFSGDVTVHMPTGSTTSNVLAADAVDPSKNDPKVTRTTAAILYQLDPVDDLAPGTYVASIEIGDRGRKSATDYRTPSVAKATFQVGFETEEKPPAGNCASCHQNSGGQGGGQGFVLDFSRHYKIFDDTAVDQCGACHDQQPQLAVGAGWTGARPISKRVHAVHYGSSLNHPLGTVDYSGGDPVAGRNWDITFPQDVRNCQTCHEDGTTSGSWATQASRLPCLGCHDGDAAKTHMKLQTWDPTPADPYSGDEEESCQACH